MLWNSPDFWNLNYMWARSGAKVNEDSDTKRREPACFEITLVLCLGTESLARLAAEPYRPLIPLKKPWNCWGRADRHTPFGQVLSFFCAFVRSVNFCVFVSVRMRVWMKECRRNCMCVFVRVDVSALCVCVVGEQSSDELLSLDRGFCSSQPVRCCWCCCVG